MTEREDEMARAINQRAQALVNENAIEENRGKTYADFKAAQKKDNWGPPAHTRSIDPEKETNETVMSQAVMAQNYDAPSVQPIDKVVKTFAAYGGFWRRLAASVLDMWPTYLVSIFVWGYIISTLVSASTISMYSENIDEMLAFIVPIGVLVGVAIINIGYNIYLYYKRGTTLGYELLGLKVIYKITGTKPKTGPLMGRFAFKFVMSVIPYVNFMYMLAIAGMIIFAKNKRAPHDVVAGTLVVSERLKKTWLVWMVNILALLLPVLAIFLGIVVDENSLSPTGIYQEVIEASDEEMILLEQEIQNNENTVEENKIIEGEVIDDQNFEEVFEG